MNPIFITIGSIHIYWYAIIILLAFVIGYSLASIEVKKQNIPKDFLSNFFFYLIPIVIIGARIYYVIFEWEQYQNNWLDIFKIWNGGLAIHGGLIAGLIFTVYYTHKYKINTLKFLDIIVVSLAIGQAIGRWGNFVNGEAYGPITTLHTLQQLYIPNFIIQGMKIGLNYYHPTFLYESLLSILTFIILIVVRKIKKIKIGQLTSIYLIMYGINRFIIEALRQDSLMLAHFKVAQIVSIFMIIGGISLMIYSVRKLEYYHER